VLRAERVERKTFLVEIPYPLYERVKLLAGAHHGRVDGEDFEAAVTLTLTFAVEDVDPFAFALRELSAGRSELVQL
jgi:putative IMPACT (imprinted ancient) family translation regulator